MRDPSVARINRAGMGNFKVKAQYGQYGRLDKPIYLKITSFCLMITLATTGVKNMSSAPYDVSVPSGRSQKMHTGNGAFSAGLFCPPAQKTRGSPVIKKYI